MDKNHIAESEGVELSAADAANLRCARLNAEARSAEHRESLRTCDALKLQREHLALLLERNAEAQQRETAVLAQRAEADQQAQRAFVAARVALGERLAPGREVFEDGSTMPASEVRGSPVVN